MTTDTDVFDLQRIATVASSLDLRKPNQEALESIVFETAQHHSLDKKPAPFEAVADVATGVGKTYVIAGVIEYFAAQGVRNFAVITPGRTILNKTVGNFTPGHPKSLLGGMEVEPLVITSDNFATANVAQAMEDEQQVKLFIFTVQSLLKPSTKQGRKTHKFQEGLGSGFYEALQGADDLFILADEHHAYYGRVFSEAVRDLKPNTLIGLTATPHRQTPDDSIIYRYPLAAAIADKLVKTPVLVGRKDDLSDPATKLLDGVALLELKEEAIANYVASSGKQPVNPVMLIVAPSIAEAEEVESVVSDPSFAGGRYADKVLTVHSDAPDEALAALAKVEELDSPYRIIVSVGMLKEGWDVKNVYVICSLRAMVSDLLTEQTLGRGLRLPFGEYTDIEILDSLEVLGHEKYEALLKKAGAINEQFVDRRTRAVLRQNAQGQYVSTLQTTEVSTPVVVAPGEDGEDVQQVGQVGGVGTGQPVVTSIGTHTQKAAEDIKKLTVELAPRTDVPVLKVPRLKMLPVQSQFSLADIIDEDAFFRLGQRIAADPDNQLVRTTISARVIEGADGLRRTELVTAPAVDKVVSAARLYPVEDLREQLLEQVLASPVVPARANQRAAAAPLVQKFFDGLGSKAQELLSAYLDRAAAGLIKLITEKQREFASKPTYNEVVEVINFRPMRTGKPETSSDLAGAFKKGRAYEGYKRSLYTQDWFDSSTERTLANMLDVEDGISYWVRLQTGDLPILWATGREYNPDFITVEDNGAHWVVEVKMDKEMTSVDVKGKREAARRWANHVTADPAVNATWRYLLASESDIATTKGSWAALKKLTA